MAIDLQKAAATLVQRPRPQAQPRALRARMGCNRSCRRLRHPGGLRQAHAGDARRRVGYKIGLTSKRMQKMCSIDHPVAGVVLEKRLYAQRRAARACPVSCVWASSSRSACGWAGRSHRATTPYTKWTRSRRRWTQSLRLSKSSTTATRRTRSICSRWSRTTPGTRASCWASGARPGPISPPRAAPSSCNGKVIDQGHGRDVLGHPFEPLRWLANHLSDARRDPARRRDRFDRQPRDDAVPEGRGELSVYRRGGGIGGGQL